MITLRTFVPLTLALMMALPFTAEARLFGSKKSKKDDTVETSSSKENKDSTAFRKSIADAQIFHGMMDAYLKKDGKLFLAIPDSLYGADLLLVSRVNGISQTTDLVAGEMNVTPMVVRLSKDPYNVYMHLVQDQAVINEKDPIASAYGRNFLDPIVKGFKIKMTADSCDFIEVTDFFKGNEKIISPIKDLNPIAVLLSGKKGMDGIKSYQIIDRLRIEPKEEDQNAYYSGAIVEPTQKLFLC